MGGDVYYVVDCTQGVEKPYRTVEGKMREAIAVAKQAQADHKGSIFTHTFKVYDYAGAQVYPKRRKD